MQHSTNTVNRAYLPKTTVWSARTNFPLLRMTAKRNLKLDTDALEITGEKSDEQKDIDLEILTQKAETEVADTAEDPTEQRAERRYRDS